MTFRTRIRVAPAKDMRSKIVCIWTRLDAGHTQWEADATLDTWGLLRPVVGLWRPRVGIRGIARATGGCSGAARTAVFRGQLLDMQLIDVQKLKSLVSTPSHPPSTSSPLRVAVASSSKKLLPTVVAVRVISRRGARRSDNVSAVLRRVHLIYNASRHWHWRSIGTTNLWINCTWASRHTSHLMGAMREVDLEMCSKEEDADFRNRCLPRLVRFSPSCRLQHTIQTYARVLIVNTAFIMVMSLYFWWIQVLDTCELRGRGLQENDAVHERWRVCTRWFTWKLFRSVCHSYITSTMYKYTPYSKYPYKCMFQFVIIALTGFVQREGSFVVDSDPIVLSGCGIWLSGNARSLMGTSGH